jgi:hypothetical protein
VALGAPCFFGDADLSGVTVGDGDGVSDGAADGVSTGCGDGDPFFFRCGEALAVGVGDVFFFLGGGDGDSFSADGDCFFFDKGVADGDDDSFPGGVADSLGLGVGVGDFFFVATALFFFRGFGVGVGVEKIFFSASPRDRSAAGDGTTVETIIASAIRILINIANGLTD